MFDRYPVQGLLLMKSGEPLKLLEPEEAIKQLGLIEHKISFETVQKLEKMNSSSLDFDQSALHSEIFLSLQKFVINVDLQ